MAWICKFDSKPKAPKEFMLQRFVFCLRRYFNSGHNEWLKNDCGPLRLSHCWIKLIKLIAQHLTFWTIKWRPAGSPICESRKLYFIFCSIYSSGFREIFCVQKISSANRSHIEKFIFNEHSTFCDCKMHSLHSIGILLCSFSASFSLWFRTSLRRRPIISFTILSSFDGKRLPQWKWQWQWQ